MSAGRLSRAWKVAWGPLLAFAAAAGLILAMTLPWCLHWRGEFLSHWDPPFHAWKLEFMARRILAGDVFCSDGNTNMLYPQSGALYFEALQWPPAVFAAMLFAGTSLPGEVVYHLSLWLFWALSAPCMYVLLRELSCGKAAAVAGAVAFCILPHRMSYCVEFQMELVFAMPLVYAFFLRFFRNGRVPDAIGLVLAWWLLAVSELYEAVFVLMSLPVLAVVFLAARPRLLCNRRLWIGGTVAAATGVLLLPAMLLPYLTQQGEGTVARSMKEVMKHCADPFSYLLPWGRFRLWTLDARPDELSLYPTFVVLLFALGAAVVWFRRDWNVASASGGPARTGWRKVRPWMVPASHALCPVFLLAFGILLAIALSGWHGWTKPFARRTESFFRLGMWAVPLLAFVPSRGERERGVFLRGLAVVALLAWVLSFGPVIFAGEDRVMAKLPNGFYVACYEKYLPFLGNFRVVSRFGVLVLFFLLCAATCFLDAGTRRKGSVYRMVFAGLFLFLCAIDSLPPGKWVSTYRKVHDTRSSPVVGRLLRERPACTLAALPMTTREVEGMRMFSLLKGDFLYVYAWGGYFPAFADEIAGAASHNVRDLWYADLASIYPDVLVLLDRRKKVPVDQWARPFAPRETAVAPDGKTIVVFEKWIEPVADLIDRDNRFALYSLKPLPADRRVVKRFRTDVARLNPALEADLDCPDAPDASIALSLNGMSLGTFRADGAGKVHIRADFADVPKKIWSKSGPNILEFVSGDGSDSAAVVRLENFSLRDRDGVWHDPCPGKRLPSATSSASLAKQEGGKE